MPVLDRLASALGRNDERPNVELAVELAASKDRAAIAELAEALSGGPVATANDAIKVLYEIGERNPELVAPHLETFVALLQSRNNRNVWGALKAIETVAAQQPNETRRHLEAILAAADRGSVIAKDAANGILVALAANGHAKEALPVLLDRLAGAAPNQFPTYAEQIATVATGAHRERLAAIVRTRLPHVAGTAKRVRLEKLLRKLAK